MSGGEPGGDDGEAEHALSELAKELCDELEVEHQFAGCFEGCMRPSGGGGGGGGRRAVRHAVVVLRRELSSDLEPVVRANQTIDRCSMDMVEALVPLKAAMKKAVGEEEEEEGEDALPALQALCTQMADGWCTQLLEVMTANMQQAFKLETNPSPNPNPNPDPSPSPDPFPDH